MSICLCLRDTITLPIDGSALLPELLAGLSPVEVGRLAIRVGNATVECGDLFAIEGESSDLHLVLEGDFRSARGLGRGLSGGTLTVRGDVGPELGAGMSGGTIEVFGSAGEGAGLAMRGGLLRIHGSAGDALGAAEPGMTVGMREGVILVDGPIGDDAGLGMRRGLIAVAGPAGDGLGRGLIAGSIFAWGMVGHGPGAGMKRGTIVLFGDRPEPPPLLPTFAPSGRDRPDIVTIYLKMLQARGFGVPASAFSGSFARYNGDLIEGGQGEILVADANTHRPSRL